MSRAPRRNVRYEYAQLNMTTNRLRKPIKKKMWIPSQASQERSLVQVGLAAAVSVLFTMALGVV
jgi:hypothetical protein